jgi:hypothetical protein
MNEPILARDDLGEIRSLIATVSPSTWRKIFEDVE